MDPELYGCAHSFGNQSKTYFCALPIGPQVDSSLLFAFRRKVLGKLSITGFLNGQLTILLHLMLFL